MIIKKDKSNSFCCLEIKWILQLRMIFVVTSQRSGNSFSHQGL